MLRKDYEGDFVIDIENRMEHKMIRMKMIRDIKKLPDENRFLIRYAQSATKDTEDVYESENRHDLMLSIK